METIPAVPVVQPTPNPVQVKKGVPKLLIGAVIAAGAIVFVLAILAAAYFFVFRKQDKILIAYPNRDGDQVDLYLLKPGVEKSKGLRLGNDLVVRDYKWVDFYQDGKNAYDMNLGAFLPGSTDVLLFYQNDDGNAVIERMPANGKDSTVLSESEEPSWIRVNLDNKTLFIEESKNNAYRCYSGDLGQEAERVAKGDYCFLSSDGNVVLYGEYSSGGYKLSALDLQKNDEATAIDQDLSPDSIQVSDDGSQVAYVVTEEGESTLSLADVWGESESELIKSFKIINYGFFPKENALYYMVQTTDGVLQLYTSKSSDPLAQGYFMTATLAPDGKTLVYLKGNALDQITAYSYSPASGSNDTLLEGKQLSIYTNSSAQQVVFLDVDDKELTIYLAKADGSDPQEVWSESDLTINEIDATSVNESIFIDAMDENGEHSFYEASRSMDDPILYFDGWSSINLLNVSTARNMLFFSGAEEADDDLSLWTLELNKNADPEELDDDGTNYYGLVFSRDEKSIIYNEYTGDNPDDVAIRKAFLNSKSDPETLYDGAYLVDNNWGDPKPRILWMFSNQLEGQTSYCPEGVRMTVGSSTDLTIPEGGSVCFSFFAREGQYVGIEVNSSETSTGQTLDPYFTLYTGDGTYLNSVDDGDYNRDPRLVYSVETTGLFVGELRENGGYEGNVTVNLLERQDSLKEAVPLALGSSANAKIDQDSRLYFASIDVDLYGTLHQLDLEAGKYYRLTLTATSHDSNDEYQMIVTDDTLQNSLNWQYLDFTTENSMTIQPDVSGTYYLIILASGENVPTSSVLDFTVKFEEVLSSLSQATPLPDNSAVRGVITASDTLFETNVPYGSNNLADIYTFRGTSGQSIQLIIDARSQGSNIDTQLTLADEDGNFITFDDDSGYDYDSMIDTSLPYTGTYYVFVTSYGDNTNTESTNFYYLTLKR